MSNFISHTTRKPRPGEVNGVHYFFVSDEEFEQIPMAASFSVKPSIAGGVIGKYGVSIAELQRVKELGVEIIGFLGRSACGKTTSEKEFTDLYLMSVISESYMVDFLEAAVTLGIPTKLLYFHASRQVRLDRMIARGDSYEDILRRFMIEDSEPELDLVRIGKRLPLTPIFVIDAEKSRDVVLGQVSKILG